MRVLIVITRGDTIGGAQTHVFLLAKYLISFGVDVLVVYGGEVTHLNELLDKNGIPNLNIPQLKKEISLINDFQTALRINSIIKSFKPDIVSLHSSKVGILGRVVSRLNGIKNIVTIHGWSFSEGQSIAKRCFLLMIEKIFFNFSDKFILVSDYDLNLAKRMGFNTSSKFVVIKNGIENYDLSNSSKPNSDSLRVCMVARFDKQKDQASLIKAVSGLSNVIVDFYGDGPYLNYCKSLASEFGVSKQVTFHGFCNNINDVLGSYDVFALISNWEGFPISTIEAMAAGLPVLVSDVGGASECVINGINGFIVPKGDINQIQERLNLFCNDRELTTQMGTSSRIIFEKNYTANIMIEKTILVYKKVLEMVI